MVSRLALNGTWQLRFCEPGDGQRQGWFTTGVGKGIAATVPGDVHLDLLDAGMIEEPLVGRNALDCAWMERKDWWYSREFEVPESFSGDRTELHFAGLDTTADVWLNGRQIGAHDTMFRPLTLDVTGLLRDGRNLLVVRLDTGLRGADGKPVSPYDAMFLPGAESPRMWIRKAQFTFGWDWAPRLLTCGIWRDVELRAYDKVAIRDCCLRTTLVSPDLARVEATLELENFTSADVSAEATLRLTGPGTHAARTEVLIQPGSHELTLRLDIPEPALWWPAPLGTPTLYDCEVELASNGTVLDQTDFRYGLRDVELVRDERTDGEESFIFAVNGHELFCKGANWVPADSLLKRVSPAKYAELVRLAYEANFNMLRVWGGGIFEDPHFYQLCDEYGILVWQDFMYACSYYPDDNPEFLAESRREAEQAVRALRNHPCVAMWCGNNENQWIHHRLAELGKAAGQLYGERIYHEVLPEVCARLDPSRPYWPSSPWGGEDPNARQRGNQHAWNATIMHPDPADQIDFQKFTADEGKFISEFGVLGPPDAETLERILPHGERAVGSPAWEFHENWFDKGAVDHAIERYWPTHERPGSDGWVLHGQVIQAEALKLAIEHWRRRTPDTAGALLWMFADCWGAVGWSLVDYYLRKKASYYAVRRAFEPVLVSVQQEAGRLVFWVVNDTLHDVRGRLTYGLLTLAESTTDEHDAAIHVPASTAKPVAKLSLSGLTDERQRRLAAYAQLTTDAGLRTRNRHFLTGLRFGALDLPEARLTHTIDGDVLALKAESFVWGARILAPTGVEPGDNYIDLLPGEERRIRLRGPADLFDRIRVGALNAKEGCDV